MGSRRKLDNSEQQTTSPQQIIDYFDELFAYALSIGMTYEQYWLQDPKLIYSYIKAEELRTKRKNQEMWLQGLYVHIAIGDLVPILNPFSKEHKARKYLDKPIPITQREQEEYERERIQKITRKLDSLVGKKLG